MGANEELDKLKLYCHGDVNDYIFNTDQKKNESKGTSLKPGLQSIVCVYSSAGIPIDIPK